MQRVTFEFFRKHCAHGAIETTTHPFTHVGAQLSGPLTRVPQISSTQTPNPLVKCRLVLRLFGKVAVLDTFFFFFCETQAIRSSSDVSRSSKIRGAAQSSSFVEVPFLGSHRKLFLPSETSLALDCRRLLRRILRSPKLRVSFIR